MAAPQFTWASTSPTISAVSYTSFTKSQPTLGLFVSTDRDIGYAKLDVERRLLRLRVAHSLSGLHHPGADLTLHPPEDERVAYLRANSRPRALTSTQPLKDAFTKLGESETGSDFRLFGATAGQGVVWYTGQFYALFYIADDSESECSRQPNIVVAIGTAARDALSFTVVGALSDRIGRKSS